MKKNLKLMLIGIVSIFIFVGCSSTARYSQSLDGLGKGSKVYIYRTNTYYHSLNPEKPFFYIDGKYITKLGTGGSTIIKVAPGKHTISVKESILFMPSYESGKVKLNVEENKNYYIRYSKEFLKVVSTSATSVSTSDTSKLMEVDEETYLKRK